MRKIEEIRERWKKAVQPDENWTSIDCKYRDDDEPKYDILSNKITGVNSADEGTNLVCSMSYDYDVGYSWCFDPDERAAAVAAAPEDIRYLLAEIDRLTKAMQKT